MKTANFPSAIMQFVYHSEALLDKMQQEDIANNEHPELETQIDWSMEYEKAQLARNIMLDFFKSNRSGKTKNRRSIQT